MVLVLGVLGRWGRGKTMTLTMLQDLTKNEPETLEFKRPQTIISNYLSKFMDYYVAIQPKVSEIYNPFTKQNVPVLDILEFLNRPVGDTEYFLFLDDIYAWLASYFFGSTFNTMALRLLAAGRKKGISIAESSVRFKDVDPRLRANHTHLFLPRFNDEANLVSIERYAVDVFEDVRIRPDVYYDASRYFDAYDTREIIESVYVPNAKGTGITSRSGLASVTAPRTMPSTPALQYIQTLPPIPTAIPSPSLPALASDGRAMPRGDVALYDGIVMQHKIAEEWRLKYPPPEYIVKEGKRWGRGNREPDILVLTKGGRPVEVVSVKSWTLFASSERMGPTGKLSGVNSRTVKRKDILPEINTALQYGIPCYLVVANLRNQRHLSIQIDLQSFDHYSTTSELTQGSEAPSLPADPHVLMQRLNQITSLDRRVIEAYYAKETDPVYRKLSNRELAEVFKIEQTELERGIQDLKLQLLKVQLESPQPASISTAQSSSDGQGRKIAFSLSKTVQASPSISQRTVETAKAFGLGIDSSQSFTIYDNLHLEIQQGDVVYTTGDSGSGKSLLLKELKPVLEKNFGKTVCEGNPSLQSTQVSDEEIVIENIGTDFDDAMRILSAAGLSEAFIMMRRYSELSDGQKYRYRIAKTINDREAKVWMFDEFAATLDRDSAKAVAYTLQSTARKMARTLIVATTHEDLFQDLNPTLYVKKFFGPEVQVQRCTYEKKACSLLQGITIEEGTKEDFEELERFHYKGESSPGAVRRTYVAKLNGNLVGGILYASCNPHLAGRSIAVPEYSKNASNPENLHLLNRDFLRIARVVVLPKYRGIGLGVKLVRETMPMTGYPYIETLAVMAKVNPFFEHAGMIRIKTPPPEERSKAYGAALESLSQLGFDLELITSASYNSEVITLLSDQAKLALQDILLKHFITPKYGGTQFKAGVEALDTEAMARALTRVRLDMAYLIWKSADPKFAPLPPVRH